MGFLDSIFKRTAGPDLPGLEALLQAEGVETVPEAVLAHREEFEHLHDLAAREAWARAVAALVRDGKPLPPLYEDLHDRLLPRLVPAWQAEREAFWKRRFMDGLTLRLEVDGQPVPAEWIILWGRSEDEVAEFALDALRKDAEKPWERLPSGIYRSPWQDGHDAARLLLPESYAALFTDQTTFLAAPHAGVLYAAPQPLLPRLVEAVSASLGQGPSVMAALLQRVDDKLVPARLQDPHPMSGPQRELKQMDLLEAMKAQVEDLDPKLGTASGAGLLRTKDRTFTVATWPEQDAPVLLPEVDLLLLANRQGQPLGLFARTSLPRLGRLRAEPVDIWGPRRVRYEGFPNEDERGRLDCAANAEQTMALLGGTKAPGVAAPPTGLPKPPAPTAPAPSKNLLSTQPVPTLPRHLQGEVGKQGSDE